MRRADPPSKESYRLFIGSRNLKSCHGPTIGCRALNNSTIQVLRIWEQSVDLRLYLTYLAQATLFVSNMLFSKWEPALFYSLGTSNLWLHFTLHCGTHLVFSISCLHQFSGNGVQRQTFPFLWVLGLTPSLIHISSRLIPTQVLFSGEYSLWAKYLYAIPECCLFINWTEVEVEVNLLSTVSRSVCFGLELPFGAHDQIFVFSLTIAGFFMWGTLSDERMSL
jgi:hypothetical protein